jgi:ABC-type nitrate/sulfonate/bicarbonate transport system ATPase subunit
MLVLRNLARTYGTTVALQPLSLNVAKGEILTVVGLSGAGKTTLLRCLSGLDRGYAGDLEIDGKPAARYWAGRRLAMVFQKYANFHWMSVRDNVVTAIPPRKRAGPSGADDADAMLRLVGLKGREDNYVEELSGGMQQRVALARALVQDADIILLDEPFGALDVANRVILQDFVKRHFIQLGKTAIFVTHDPEEAIYVGDRVLVLDGFSKNNHVFIEVGHGRFEGQNDKLSSDFARLVRNVELILLEQWRAANSEGS